MWNLFKKPKPLPPLTNEIYAMWLRAQKPPWEWFVRQPGLIQSQLAIIGDEYTEDQALAIGSAVRNPVAAAAGAGDENAEEALALLLSAAHRQTPENGPQSFARRTPPTMGGVTERRTRRVLADRVAKDDAMSFCGRKPDPINTEDSSG